MDAVRRNYTTDWTHFVHENRDAVPQRALVASNARVEARIGSSHQVLRAVTNAALYAGRCVARRRRSILLHRARLRRCGCVVRSLELLRHARCAQGARLRRVIRSGCVLCSTAQRTKRRVTRSRRGHSRPSCTTEMQRMRVLVPGVAPSRSLRARRPPKANNLVDSCSVQYSAAHRAACGTASARAFATIVHE